METQMLRKIFAVAAVALLCAPLATLPADAGTYIDASSFGAALVHIPGVRARNLAPLRVVYGDDLTSWGGQAQAMPLALEVSRAISRRDQGRKDTNAHPSSSDPHLLETLYGRVFLERMIAEPPTWLQGGSGAGGASGFLLSNPAIASVADSYGAIFTSGGATIWAVANPVAVVNVPEPASIALFGAGLLGLNMVRRRKGATPA